MVHGIYQWWGKNVSDMPYINVYYNSDESTDIHYFSD